jgi:hypothetical protein
MFLFGRRRKSSASRPSLAVQSNVSVSEKQTLVLPESALVYRLAYILATVKLETDAIQRHELPLQSRTTAHRAKR